MNFEKLAPWNWFKKEEEQNSEIIPVKHNSNISSAPASMHELHTELERIFNSIRHNIGLSGGLLSTADWLKPSLDIASDNKEYSIKVELPGIDANNITIEYTDDTLKIKGEKHQEKEEREKDFYRVERSYGSFQRTLNIPEDADTDKITSKYKDGVLSITVPRKILPQKDTKKIKVKVE